MKKRYLYLLLILATSLFCFSPAMPTLKADHNPTWWDYDWNQRLEYTVNYTLVDEDLVNFPVLIYIDESVVDWGDIQNDLDDIRFTGDYLDELDFEIDSFVLNSEAWFWVRLPEVSSSVDTYFFMYFDNKFCVSGENAEAVWDEYTVMVQHMNDETTSTILDSTNYNKDGTKVGANEPIETDGKIAKAQSFDGLNDKINYVNFDISDWSYGFWIKILSFAGARKNVFRQNGAPARAELAIEPLTNEKITFISIDDDTARIDTSSISKLSTTVFKYLTITRSASTDKITVYMDGTSDNDNADVRSGTFTMNSVYEMGIGNYGYGNFIIDEYRQSSVARSSAWIKANYYAGALELVYEGYHTGVSYARRGEILAAALVASLILVPLLILVIFAARRK